MLPPSLTTQIESHDFDPDANIDCVDVDCESESDLSDYE
jgi:hypothetical protein